VRRLTKPGYNSPVNLLHTVASNYTQTMVRRLASLCLLWLGLSGLLPAAVACTMDMPTPAQECCSGRETPCKDPGVVMPEQLECCALEVNTGPIAASPTDKIKRVLVDDLTDDGIESADVSVVALAATPGHAPPPPPPRELRLDQSSLWLHTARLRL
jgi:hypothetical protein